MAARRRVGPIALIIVISALFGASPTGAQEPAPTAEVSARVTGDGPWTSWLGGRADRVLVVTVENTGDAPLVDPTIALRIGTGDPEPTATTQVFGEFAPGEQRTFDLDIALPRFAAGTYTVAGELVDVDGSAFRTETSHVPWLLLLLPLLVLIQITMVALRNRARRHLTAAIEAPVTVDTAISARGDADPAGDEPDPTGDEAESERGETATEPAAVIEAELDHALADLRRREVDDQQLLLAVERRAKVATERVSAELDLSPQAEIDLARRLTRALLARLDANVSAG